MRTGVPSPTSEGLLITQDSFGAASKSREDTRVSHVPCPQATTNPPEQAEGEQRKQEWGCWRGTKPGWGLAIQGKVPSAGRIWGKVVGGVKSQGKDRKGKPVPSHCQKAF